MEAYKILAVDYDDTIFHTDSSTYDLIPDWDIISQIRERQKEGWDIVLLTTMEDRWDLGHAIKMCEDFAVHFTAINDNPWWVHAIKGQPNKIYWNELIDRWGFHEGKGCEIPEGFDENWGLEDETKNISS